MKTNKTVQPSNSRHSKLNAAVRTRQLPLIIAFAVVSLSMGFTGLPQAQAEGESTPKESVVKVNPYTNSTAHSEKNEEKDVINVLQIMGNAYATGDIAEYIKHLDNNCSVYDEEKNRMVKGKDAVIAALTEKFAKNSKSGSDHIVSYTIDQPYVKVNGEMAVVTYHVIEKVEGHRPRTLEGSMSDVFQKESGQWMKVHQRAEWKRVK